MKNFIKIINWFWKNILKLLIISLVLTIAFALIIILIPIFQFADFIGDFLDQMQNIIHEFENEIEEYPREKRYQDRDDETA